MLNTNQEKFQNVMVCFQFFQNSSWQNGPISGHSLVQFLGISFRKTLSTELYLGWSQKILKKKTGKWMSGKMLAKIKFPNLKF